MKSPVNCIFILLEKWAVRLSGVDCIHTPVHKNLVRVFSHFKTANPVA